MGGLAWGWEVRQTPPPPWISTSLATILCSQGRAERGIQQLQQHALQSEQRRREVLKNRAQRDESLLEHRRALLDKEALRKQRHEREAAHQWCFIIHAALRGRYWEQRRNTMALVNGLGRSAPSTQDLIRCAL